MSWFRYKRFTIKKPDKHKIAARNIKTTLLADNLYSSYNIVENLASSIQNGLNFGVDKEELRLFQGFSEEFLKLLLLTYAELWYDNGARRVFWIMSVSSLKYHHTVCWPAWVVETHFRLVEEASKFHCFTFLCGYWLTYLPIKMNR